MAAEAFVAGHGSPELATLAPSEGCLSGPPAMSAIPKRITLRGRSASGEECVLASRACWNSEFGLWVCELEPASSREMAALNLLDLVHRCPELMVVLNSDGLIEFANAALKPMLGFCSDEAAGMDFTSTLHPKERTRAREAFRRVLLQPDDVVTVELRFRHRDGGWRYLELMGRQFRRLVGEPALLFCGRDISHHKALEKQLQRHAFFDSVTGLANRSLLLDRLQRSLATLRRNPGHLAILYLDLDRFKLINDVYGHSAGDELLQRTGHRLRECVRDIDTVSRFGGDEFTILLGRLTRPEDVTIVANRIMQRLSLPYLIGSRELFARASIGIALGTGRDHPEDLLRNADVALYRAKAAGKGRYMLFDEEMSAEMLRRLELETDLHLALEREQFRIHYQPVVELDSGRIVGVEALVRWEHPELGLIPPSEFLPIAEDAGLMSKVGLWIRLTACSQVAEWNRGLEQPQQIYVRINLSQREFYNPHLVDETRSVLSQTGLDSSCLRMEVTESLLAAEPEGSRRVLLSLRDLGVRVGIDRFGAGYSSLSHLQQLPIDILKIDRGFINELSGDRSSGLSGRS